jgi:hypothetical protein
VTDLARRARNRANHIESRLAAASTPKQRVPVLYDMCRTLAGHLEEGGDNSVWSALEAALATVYRQHTE